MPIRTVLLAALALLVQRTPAATLPQPYGDPDAYAVYAAAFSQAPRDRRMIIVDETARDPRCFPKGEALSDAAWGEAAQHYLAENKTPRALTRSIDMKSPYVLLPAQQWRGLFLRPDWRPFWQRYGEGSGYTRVSAVGFDRSRTKAMIYSDYACGPKCGEGGYKLYTKAGGRWRATVVNADLCSWIS